MNKFLEAFKYFIAFTKTLEKGEYDGDMVTLKSDFELVRKALYDNFPKFPYFIERATELEVARSVIDENQLDFAQEFKKMEPELRYKNEWDSAESIHEFEAYITKVTASKIAEELIEVVRPDLEEHLRKEIRKSTKQEQVHNLYDLVSK